MRFLKTFVKEEFDILNDYIDHNRVRKLCVCRRQTNGELEMAECKATSNKQVFSNPGGLYMLVEVCVFARFDKQYDQEPRDYLSVLRNYLWKSHQRQS